MKQRILLMLLSIILSISFLATNAQSDIIITSVDGSWSKIFGFRNSSSVNRGYMQLDNLQNLYFSSSGSSVTVNPANNFSVRSTSGSWSKAIGFSDNGAPGTLFSYLQNDPSKNLYFYSSGGYLRVANTNSLTLDAPSGNWSKVIGFADQNTPGSMFSYIQNDPYKNLYISSLGGNIRVSSTNNFTLASPVGSWSKVIGFADQNTPGTMLSYIQNDNNKNLYLASQGGSVVVAKDLRVDNGTIVVGPVSSAPSGYRLYVKDGILTERVRVALNGSASWADFVFNKRYKLATLGQVERYILKNSHLEGIPSTEEVKKNGYEVNEMIPKLLAKIEELTLYSISLQKQVDKLSKDLKKLKK